MDEPAKRPLDEVERKPSFIDPEGPIRDVLDDSEEESDSDEDKDEPTTK